MILKLIQNTKIFKLILINLLKTLNKFKKFLMKIIYKYLFKTLKFKIKQIIKQKKFINKDINK